MGQAPLGAAPPVLPVGLGPGRVARRGARDDCAQAAVLGEERRRQRLCSRQPRVAGVGPARQPAGPPQQALRRTVHARWSSRCDQRMQQGQILPHTASRVPDRRTSLTRLCAQGWP